MSWFRSHLKHGSRLALLALAIQLVLSFGHSHGFAAQAAAIQSAAPAAHVSAGGGLTDPASDSGTVAAADLITGSGPQSGSDREQAPAADSCAICAVMALAHAVLFAEPPVLLLPQAVSFLYLTTDAEFIHLNSARIAFQPRAPPAS